MKNPFSTVVHAAGRLLTADPNLDVRFVKLPPGMAAGYSFADPPNNPRPVINLPRIDVTKLDAKQQVRLAALMTHEVKHHDKSSKEVLDTAKKLNKKALFSLLNHLEDARIELNPENQSPGAEQDLDEFNLDDFKETSEKPDNQAGNRWGWLFFSFFYGLREIGTLSISDDMKKFSEIGWEILNDGRFQASTLQGREGGWVCLQLAKEMMEKFQEERDKEEEEKGNDKDDNDSGYKEEDQEAGQSSGESGEGEGGDPANSSDAQDPEMDPQKNGEGVSKSPERPGDETGKGDARGDPKPSVSDDQKGAAEGNDTNGSAVPGSDDPQDDLNLADDHPRSIEAEYAAAQENKDTKLATDKLGQIVAALADQTDDKANFDPAKDKRDPFGNYHTKTPKSEGDPYIPYSAEDRERIAKSMPDKFNQIQAEISVQVSNLRRNISRMLMDKSQCTVERNLRRGSMDPRQYYKIAKGNKRVKMQIDEGISLDAAVTLLIDLSGSMMGSKAALAVKVATVFGEALKSFPQIPFEILGYNSEALSKKSKDKAERCGFVRNREYINYWIFKSFKDNWRTVRDRMGAAAVNLNKGGATGGCNCDHENLIHAAKRLCDRPESNRVLIVLCDGAPSGHNRTYDGYLVRGLKETVLRVRQAGIKLFCFGIMSDEVKQYYAPDVEIVHNLEDLNRKALIKLTEFLLNT